MGWASDALMLAGFCERRNWSTFRQPGNLPCFFTPVIKEIQYHNFVASYSVIEPVMFSDKCASNTFDTGQ
jgi:hypothetical protein